MISVRHVDLIPYIHSLKKYLQNQHMKYLCSVCMYLLEHYPTEIQEPILNNTVCITISGMISIREEKKTGVGHSHFYIKEPAFTIHLLFGAWDLGRR